MLNLWIGSINDNSLLIPHIFTMFSFAIFVKVNNNENKFGASK